MTKEVVFEISGNVPQLAIETADYIRRGHNVDTHVVIGPIVWQLKGDLRQWYFAVASADRHIARFDQLVSTTKPLAEEFRAALTFALIQLPQPVVIHDMDDELKMARLCETLWPSTKTREIRLGIEAERRFSTVKGNCQ